MNKKSGQSKAAADKVVKGIRRKTRKHYSAEEKIGCVSTTCRYFGISLRVFINGVAPVGSAALAG